MKKTLIITSILLAFICFSCDDEPLDSNIVLQNPTNGGGNGNGGGNNGGGNNGGGNGGGNNGATLTSYAYDVDSTLPLFGTIITNTDFTISQNKVTSLATEVIFGTIPTNAIGVYTRDGNGKIIRLDATTEGIPTEKTTINYSGDNISEIVYEDLIDPTENYTYSFAYSGNVVTRTTTASTEKIEYTFDSNSQLISVESFTGTTSTQLETLTYAGGNCIAATTTGANAGSYTLMYDSFTNPSKAVFNDQYLLSIFNIDYEDEVGDSIATFHSTNNWIGVQDSGQNITFNITYNTDNNITSRIGTIDLGDGFIFTLDETFQY